MEKDLFLPFHNTNDPISLKKPMASKKKKKVWGRIL